MDSAAVMAMPATVKNRAVAALSSHHAHSFEGCQDLKRHLDAQLHPVGTRRRARESSGRRPTLGHLTPTCIRSMP